MVDELSDELDGRLRAVLLYLGHVDVVDEQDHLLAGRRPDQVLPLLGELVLVHQEVQHVLAAGLSGEVEAGEHELSAIELHQVLLDDDGLADPGLPADKQVPFASQQHIGEVLELGGVRGRDQDVEVGDFAVIDELLDLLAPRSELLQLEVDVVVEDVALLGELGDQLRDLGFHLVREEVSVLPRLVGQVPSH